MKIKETLKTESPNNYRILAILPVVMNSIIFFQMAYLIPLAYIFGFSFGIMLLLEFLLYKKWTLLIKDSLILIFHSFVLSLIIPQNIPANSVWISAMLMSGAFYIQIKSGYKLFSPPLIGFIYILFMFNSNFYFPQVSNVLERYSNVFPDVMSSSTPYTQYFKNGVEYEARQIFAGIIMGTPSEIFIFSILIGFYLLAIRFIISFRIVITAILSYIAAAAIVYLFKIHAYDKMTIQSLWYFLLITPAIFTLTFLIDDGFITPSTNKGKFFYGALFGLLSLSLKVIFGIASCDAYLILLLLPIIKIPELIILKKNKTQILESNE